MIVTLKIDRIPKHTNITHSISKCFSISRRIEQIFSCDILYNLEVLRRSSSQQGQPLNNCIMTKSLMAVLILCKRLGSTECSVINKSFWGLSLKSY